MSLLAGEKFDFVRIRTTTRKFSLINVYVYHYLDISKTRLKMYCYTFDADGCQGKSIFALILENIFLGCFMKRGGVSRRIASAVTASISKIIEPVRAETI